MFTTVRQAQYVKSLKINYNKKSVSYALLIESHIKDLYQRRILKNEHI